MKLRNLGIYALPDGRELIADTLYTGSYSLYSTLSWDSYCIADYLVNKDGQLLSKGKPTRWSIDELRYTGRKARYPKAKRPL
jgi:hypothetical protein